MKLNWGIVLAGIYVCFMILMLSLVYQSTKHDVNLVTPDYYQKNLDYQTEIDALTNVKQLKDKIEIKQQGKEIVINLANQFDSSVKGEVIMFRPSDHNLDERYTLAVSDDAKMVIPVDKLKSGAWIVKVYWNTDGKDYQFKENVFL